MIPFYEKEESNLRIFKSPQFNFPPHLHPQMELIYLEEGCLDVTVNRKSFSLKKGDFLAVFPNSVHDCCTSVQTSTSLLFVIAAPSLAGEFAGILQKFHPESPMIAASELHPDIPYAMKGMFLEWNAPNKERTPSPVQSALLQLVLARALAKFSLVKNTDAGYGDLTYRVVDYLSQNYSQPLSLPSMAKALGVSKYHLSRVFSAKLHTSFSDYLGSIRVGHAQNLLRSTEDPVTKIAFDCGFESQRTFNRVFRQRTGTSPSQYRNEP